MMANYLRRPVSRSSTTRPHRTQEMSGFNFVSVCLAAAAAGLVSLVSVSADEYGLLKSVAYPTKCLHIKGDGAGGNGAEMDLAPCDSASAFQLINVGAWPSRIQFKAGKCSTGPNDGNGANGIRAITWDCVGVGWQVYKLNGAQIQGSNGKCLTAEAAGAYIDQWDCVNQPHQQFTLDSGSEWKLLKNVAYPGKCLHIKGDSGGNGAELEMAACDGGSATQLVSSAAWSAVANGGGGEVHFKSGKCVTGPNDGNRANGIRAITWDCVPVGHQKYKLNGAQIQGANGQCLTAEGGGSYLDQWDCVNVPHQQWSLEGGGGGAVVAAEPRKCTSEGDMPGFCHTDAECCAGNFCGGGSILYCFRIKKVGDLCGDERYSRCETGSSCQIAPDGYNHCTPGTCSKVGEECNKPCCAGTACGSWQGKRVCRPEPPRCSPPNEKGPCPSNGMSCCGMHCKETTSTTFLVTSTSQVCDCSAPGYACMDDGYCCSGGKCSFGYVCQ